MTNKKIKELSDFFYSSNSQTDIPLRISITTGQYSGFDLTKTAFQELLKILNKSVNLKTDLVEFLEKYEQ